MFKAAQGINTCDWTKEGQEVARYIEAFKYTQSGIPGDNEPRSATLKNDEIVDWVYQRGHFAASTTKDGALVGGIRLLILNRRQYEPLDFSISQRTWDTIEHEFKLMPATLTYFSNDVGMHARSFDYDTPPDGFDFARLALVLKATQKSEIGNFGLSMNYDTRTRITSAVLYGHGISLTNFNRYNPDIQQPGLLTILRDAYSAWTHPLVLPCLLATDHLRRTRLFCDLGSAMQDTWAIEHDLGVTFVGRNLAVIPSASGTGANAGPASFSRTARLLEKAQANAQGVAGIGRAKAEELTVRINTHSTRIIFTARAPRWNAECTALLLDLMPRVRPTSPSSSPSSSPPSSTQRISDAEERETHHALTDLLEVNLTLAAAVSAQLAATKERLTLQLNTLYTVTAQMDSALSARIAASSGRDSVSMKILAFITAMFLPGTFVATLFSMGMFDWRFTSGNASSSASASSSAAGTGTGNGSGDGDGQGVVAGRFWIYWAVSVPLTAVTLVGWGIWWTVEMGRYKRAFADAMRGGPGGGGGGAGGGSGGAAATSSAGGGGASRHGRGRGTRGPSAWWDAVGRLARSATRKNREEGPLRDSGDGKYG